VPIIVEQFAEFIKTLPQSYEGFKIWVESGLIPTLNSVGIPTQDLKKGLTGDLPGKLEIFFNAFVGGFSGLFTGVSIILTSLVNIILVPFLTFYISKDYNNLKHYVKHLFPEGKREKVVIVYRKVDKLLGKFLRGALIVAVLNGIIAGVGLYVIGVKYAALLGVIAGILDFIPYFGLLISLLLATIVALLSGNPLVQAPLTVLLFLGQNLLETTYISPKFIGERVGLHPAILILSLLIFEYFFGFFGMLIALPTVSIIMMFVNEYLEKRDPAFKQIKKE
jgi:predicted PurR-regulated permease PerM